MNLNATFLVQSFNFLITYIVVRYVLLKPILAIIRKQENDELALSSIIERTKIAVAKKQQERVELWAACQKHFQKRSPQPLDSASLIVRNITPDIEPKTFDPQEIDQLVKAVSSQIVSRVKGGVHG